MRAMRNARLLLSFVCGAALMPAVNALHGSSPSRHVYELRLYHVNPGKMQALVERFGNHTDAVFKHYNMQAVGYWVPEDAPNSQNLFVYILEHRTRDEAKKNWDAFHDDADWKKVKAESEAQGALADHIDSYFMDPTSFSTLQ